MKYIFNQFRGLGDVLFLMAIAEAETKKGNLIIWPIEKQYLEIEKHFPDVCFCGKEALQINLDRKDIYLHEGKAVVVPFRFADELMNVKYWECMRAKYYFFEEYVSTTLNWKHWRNFEIKRFAEKEEELFRLLGLKNGEEYVLENKNFRTNFSGKGKIKELPRNKKVVSMRNIPGFTLIDWSAVIERASEIHTVGTSINYLIEKLNIRCDVHLYKREPEEKDFKNYEYLLDKQKIKYIFHR